MNNELDHDNSNLIVCVIGCVFDQTLALVLYMRVRIYKSFILPTIYIHVIFY